MSGQDSAEPSGAGEREPLLDPLLPAGDPATAAETVSGFGLWERAATVPAHPHVVLNMVATADGRATLDGRSGPISSPADRALFHALRTAVDAVLVGAGTVRTERYGRLIADQRRREQRRDRGLPDEPLACIVSGRLALDGDIPLLAEPDARVAVLTSSPASLPTAAAQVEYVRTHVDGRLDLAAGLAELSARFAVQSVLCEGGPHLCSQLLAAGLVDELFLSIEPTLAGGEPATGQALRILAGAELEPPAALRLTGVLESASALFLRYGVSA